VIKELLKANAEINKILGGAEKADTEFPSRRYSLRTAAWHPHCAGYHRGVHKTYGGDEEGLRNGRI